MLLKYLHHVVATPLCFSLREKAKPDLLVAWSTGNITDEMVQEYLEHHRDPSNADTGNIILE